MVQAPANELGDGLVNLGTDPGHRGFGDPGLVTEGFDQVVDFPGGDTIDPGLTDHRVQCLVDSSAWGQQGGEE